MKNDKVDLGFIDDAIDLIADLGCAETHTFRDASEFKDKDLFELAIGLRKDRSMVLRMIIKEGNGENYCRIKHLAKCSRMWEELGNRMFDDGNQELGEEFIEKSKTYKNICKLLSTKEVNNV